MILANKSSNAIFEFFLILIILTNQRFFPPKPRFSIPRVLISLVAAVAAAAEVVVVVVVEAAAVVVLASQTLCLSHK